MEKVLLRREQSADWIRRPSKIREQDLIIGLEKLQSILPIAQARGIEVTTLRNAGEPYPAPDYWRPKLATGSDSEGEGATHTGRGLINDGIVPEDSTYVKFTAQTVKDLKDFWEEVRKQEQEKAARTEKIKTTA